MPGLSLYRTADGSYTIYNEDIDECYHSKFGAIAESKHVFIKNGLELIQSKEVQVFEAGFGTGLNALLTAIYAENHHLKISYFAVEKYPLSHELINSLDYNLQLGVSNKLFKRLHTSPWNKMADINPYFTLQKIDKDLNHINFNEYKNIDLVYFDAFSPAKQAELWSTELFQKLYNILKPGGILVTYASSGIVKFALRDAAFKIKRLKGPPGKHHMILATKTA